MDTRTKAYEVYLYLTEDLRAVTVGLEVIRNAIREIWGTEDHRQHKIFIQVMEKEGWIKQKSELPYQYEVFPDKPRPLSGRQRREQLREQRLKEQEKPSEPIPEQKTLEGATT